MPPCLHAALVPHCLALAPSRPHVAASPARRAAGLAEGGQRLQAGKYRARHEQVRVSAGLAIACVAMAASATLTLALARPHRIPPPPGSCSVAVALLPLHWARGQAARELVSGGAGCAAADASDALAPSAGCRTRPSSQTPCTLSWAKCSKPPVRAAFAACPPLLRLVCRRLRPAQCAASRGASRGCLVSSQA